MELRGFINWVQCTVLSTAVITTNEESKQCVFDSWAHSQVGNQEGNQVAFWLAKYIGNMLEHTTHNNFKYNNFKQSFYWFINFINGEKYRRIVVFIPIFGGESKTEKWLVTVNQRQVGMQVLVEENHNSRSTMGAWVLSCWIVSDYFRPHEVCANASIIFTDIHSTFEFKQPILHRGLHWSDPIQYSLLWTDASEQKYSDGALFCPFLFLTT